MIHMTPSSWLYNFLKQYEKFRPTAYRPTPRDVWTAGWGHTEGVTEATTCTMAQANEWLQDDVAQAALDVNKWVNVALNQNQYDALVSLRFNIGGPQFMSSGLLHYINQELFVSAAADFKNWDKQAGEVLPGLLARREAEAQHFQLAA